MKKIGNRIVIKSIAGILVPLVLLAAFVSIFGYRMFTDGMMEIYETGAIQIARTAASEIDMSKLDVYLASGGTTEEYRKAWDEMDRLCNSSGATFIYMIVPDLTDYDHITFVFSTINKESRYTKYDFGYYRQTTNDDYRKKYRALFEGTSEEEIVIRDQGYIETDAHITAMVPMKFDGQTKAILCVQRQMENLTAVRNRFLRVIFWVMGGLLLIVIVGQHFYMRRALLNPIRKITEEAVRFAEEEKPAERKLGESIRTKDEIETLAVSIDRMEEEITRYMKELTAATAEKERISTELALATRIQADTLPSDFPAFPDRKEFDIYATMTPAKEVGGDFYDFFLTDENHLAIVMADVSGKGVPAALFMMVAKLILNNIALTGGSPREVLEKTNERICQTNREEMFVTVWLGILDLRTGKLTAANAGHEYPVVTRNGGTFELVKDKHGFVIGGMEGVRYTEYELELEKGGELFLYTDGVPEATDAHHNFYGTDRMMDILNRNPSLAPEQVLEMVKADVDQFVGNASQFDDLTMLCVRYNGPDGQEKE